MLEPIFEATFQPCSYGFRPKRRACDAVAEIVHLTTGSRKQLRVGDRRRHQGDLPAEKTTYALRDIEHLRRMAAAHGPAIGDYASAVLDHPLPWTKMRQAYALLGLVKRWGPERVEAACARALDAEAISVPLIGRMIERATEAQATATPPAPANKPARFERDPGHFSTTRPNQDRGSPPDGEAFGAEGGAA